MPELEDVNFNEFADVELNAEQTERVLVSLGVAVRRQPLAPALSRDSLETRGGGRPATRPDNEQGHQVVYGS